MKNQYAGDVNDYVKYSLVRKLVAAAQARVVTVCWMRTLDDDRTDGESLPEVIGRARTGRRAG